MKTILSLCLLGIVLPLAACGHKGKLKTPEQIELEAAKAENDEPEEDIDINVSEPELQPKLGQNLNETRPHSPSVGNY